MKARTKKIGDERVLIVDDAVPRELIESIYDAHKMVGFSFGTATSLSTELFDETMADLDPINFQLTELGRIKSDLSVALEFCRKAVCYQALVNCIGFGDHTFSHVDSSEFDAFSVLYYANSFWKPEWAGETIFYNGMKDAEFAISVRPGRLVFFGGRVQHRPGVPSPLAEVERLTISSRYVCDTNVS